jgi:L-ascorbate metabolism protein UlaG (beta-lactamase superfamily)
MINRRTFIRQAALTGVLATIKPSALISSTHYMKPTPAVRLLRNATIIIEMNGKQILVDPFLGNKGAYDPVPWTSNNIRNPMTDLPVTQDELANIIHHTDAVLITHTHNDHWDIAAQQLIPKDKIIIGQPEDKAALEKQGFVKFAAITDPVTVEGIRITRVPAQHGKGEIAARMAPVSGFVLDDGTYRIYIAGDTVWYEGVKHILREHKPHGVILNAGGARFDIGDPIIMTAEDVLQVCAESPAATIICVHMEAVNHCYLKRSGLKQAIRNAGYTQRCVVPEDGERMVLEA